MIKAVIFDLDDTLYPEIEYVKSGFQAIANAFGNDNIKSELFSLFIQDKNNVYQRFGFSKQECDRCIKIYRKHKPTLNLSEEVVATLKDLKNREYKLGIITDGRPEGQWNKIYALGLDRIIDRIIVTDELGGPEYRKPNPRAFELMHEILKVNYDEMIYIGDNPTKDFIAPQKLGMKFCYYKGIHGLYTENDFKTNLMIQSIGEVLNIC